MKNQKNLKKIFLFARLLLISIFFLINFEISLAQEIQPPCLQYPCKKIVEITAYYSPMPYQDKYTTGTYEGDIQLNGYGIHGADGTSVYPGMIAAPKNYPFGTQIEIPGLGRGTVHDRGGAIKNAGSDLGNKYDRLDLWVGYDNAGLRRAWKWGKRTIEITIYGIQNTLPDEMYFEGLEYETARPELRKAPDNSTSEKYSSETNNLPRIKSIIELTAESPKKIESPDIFNNNLKFGDKSAEVKILQEELKKLGLFNTEATGFYGRITEHAVFKFQQIKGIISRKDQLGAGIFGNETRNNLNLITNARLAQIRLIAEKKNKNKSRIALKNNFGFGSRGNEVTLLQTILKKEGYLNISSPTGYFGEETRKAVLAFQLHHKLINAENHPAAGYVGPRTRETLEEIS